MDAEGFAQIYGGPDGLLRSFCTTFYEVARDMATKLVEPPCPVCREPIKEFRQFGDAIVMALPCTCLLPINQSLTEGAVMSDARNNPDILTETPSDGPQMGLMLPDKVLRKSDFPVAASKVVDRLLEGLDAPTAFILLRQVVEVAKAAESQIKERVMMACAGAKTTIGGAKIEYRQSAAKWDYKNDMVRQQLLSDIDTLKEQLKNREAFLQALPEAVTDGNGVTIIPATKEESEYTLAVTFEK